MQPVLPETHLRKTKLSACSYMIYILNSLHKEKSFNLLPTKKGERVDS